MYNKSYWQHEKKKKKRKIKKLWKIKLSTAAQTQRMLMGSKKTF